MRAVLLLLIASLALATVAGCTASRWATGKKTRTQAVPPTLWVPESIGAFEDGGGGRPKAGMARTAQWP